MGLKYRKQKNAFIFLLKLVKPTLSVRAMRSKASSDFITFLAKYTLKS
jgi:hypothetical protein